MVTDRSRPRGPRRRERRAQRPPAAPGVYHAIADGTRRAILDRLARAPTPVAEIARGFPMSRPAISKHLRTLARAGLVHAMRAGRRRLYELDPAPLGEIDLWLTRVRMAWAARLVSIKRQIEAEADSSGAHPPPEDGAP